jgi:hypothetical protein
MIRTPTTKKKQLSMKKLISQVFNYGKGIEIITPLNTGQDFFLDK